MEPCAAVIEWCFGLSIDNFLVFQDALLMSLPRDGLDWNDLIPFKEEGHNQINPADFRVSLGFSHFPYKIP